MKIKGSKNMSAPLVDAAKGMMGDVLSVNRSPNIAQGKGDAVPKASMGKFPSDETRGVKKPTPIAPSNFAKGGKVKSKKGKC